MDGVLMRQVLQVVAAAVCGWFVLESYRWIRRRSTTIGLLFAGGLLIRAFVGLALFWISYLRLPVAQSLQYRDGFWMHASDAPMYYDLGARTVEFGFGTLPMRWPSPVYIKVLGGWMWLVGISPAAGLFLNVCLYAALCLVLVWLCAPKDDWRRDLPCVVAVAGLSFSPVIVIYGTQALKEHLTYFLLAAIAVGMLIVTRPLTYAHAQKGRLHALVAGIVLTSAATYFLSGIRWYFGVMVWCTLVLVLALFLFVGRTAGLLRYVAGSCVLLVCVWLAYWGAAETHLGPGPGSPAAARIGSGSFNLPSTLPMMVQQARRLFLLAGGDTNVVVPLREAPPGDDVESKNWTAAVRRVRTGMPNTVVEHLWVLGVGLALVFVPVSLLKAANIVELSGGAGMLSVADLDAAFLDVTMLVALVLIWKRRRLIGDRLPFVVFGLVLAAVTAVLLAFVVTNFGTLLRLRPLIAIPLWVLAIAISAEPQNAEIKSAADDADSRR